MLAQTIWSFNLIFVILRLILLHKDKGSVAEMRYEEKIVMARKLSARFIAEFPDDKELRRIASKKKSGSCVVIVCVLLASLIEFLLVDNTFEKIALLILVCGIIICEIVRIAQADDLRRYTKLYGIVAGNETMTQKTRYGETRSYRLVVCYREPAGEVKARVISCDKETYDCIKLTRTCFVILDKGRVADMLINVEGV